MLDESAAQVDRVYRFGPFSLSPKQRLLLEDGEPVRLGCRAIQMLIVLVERNGDVLGKEELIARVWANIAVVDGNLTTQMTALRCALHDGRNGNRYICNERGRGYRFIAPVTAALGRELGPPAAPVPTTADQPSPFDHHFCLVQFAQVRVTGSEKAVRRDPIRVLLQ